MLSSITPMTEAGRGYRFSSTARWFVAGGILGGCTTGAVAALAATGVGALDLSDPARWGIGAVVAAATAAVDLGIAGVELPIFKRQVNDAWLRRYRSWVYGGGFGWQIGTGVATYIMTAAVLLTVGLAILTGDPAAALLIGFTFGTVRGAAVYLGRSATTPAALGQVHDRLDRLAPATRAAAAGVQVVAAVALAGAAWGVVAAAGVGLALVLARALVARGQRRPAAV